MESVHLLEAQFAGWLREYRPILIKVAGSFAAEPVEQADLFQDMAIEIWQSLPQFKGQAKPAKAEVARTLRQTAFLHSSLGWLTEPGV